MKHFVSFGLWLAVLLAIAPANAQAPTGGLIQPILPSTNAAVPTIRARVNEVSLLFVVTDKRGRFVRDLTQDDVTILDDHKPPEAIFSFRTHGEMPLRLGVLIDLSASIESRFEFEQNAIANFLRHTVRPGVDEAFLTGFSRHSQMVQDFTDRAPLLEGAIHRLRVGGGTALYDAIYKACQEKFLESAAGHPVRKALLVVSDGDDNLSEVSRRQAIEMAQRAEVTIYAVSTNDTGDEERGDRVLEQLADETGGEAFFPNELRDVPFLFSAVADELRSQYVVSYRPADFDEHKLYRPIEITARRKHLYVRARKGYFVGR